MTAAALLMAIPTQELSTMPSLGASSKKTAGAGDLFRRQGGAAGSVLSEAQLAKTGTRSIDLESQQAQRQAVWKETLAAQGNLAAAQTGTGETEDADLTGGLTGKQQSLTMENGAEGGSMGMRSRTTATVFSGPSGHAVSNAAPKLVKAGVYVEAGSGAGKVDPGSALPADAAKKKAGLANSEKGSSAAKTKERTPATRHASAAASAQVVTVAGSNTAPQALSSSVAAQNMGLVAGGNPPERPVANSAGYTLHPEISRPGEVATLAGEQPGSAVVLPGLSHGAPFFKDSNPSVSAADSQNSSAGGGAHQIDSPGESALEQGGWINSLGAYGVAPKSPGASLLGKAEAEKSVSAASGIAANHPALSSSHNSVSATGNKDGFSAGEGTKAGSQSAAPVGHAPKAGVQKEDAGASTAAHSGGQAERQSVVLKDTEPLHEHGANGQDSGLSPHGGAELAVGQLQASAKGNPQTNTDQVSPFQMMDTPQSASPASSAPQFHASPASSGLVAGYHDPQLGYIELKAHLGSDGVHASIAAATPEASSILAGHMPALHQWLHERQTLVETLTVGLRESAADRSAGNMAGQGGSSGGAFAGGNSSFSAGDGQQHGGWGGDHESSANANRFGSLIATRPRAAEDSSNAASAASAAGLRAGAAYISVLA